MHGVHIEYWNYQAPFSGQSWHKIACCTHRLTLTAGNPDLFGALPEVPGLALPCPALTCPALPCPALPSPALPCPALHCIALATYPSTESLLHRHTRPAFAKFIASGLIKADPASRPQLLCVQPRVQLTKQHKSERKYHIISYHIISYHIISYHIISYHIISYYITLHYIIFFYIILYYH